MRGIIHIKKCDNKNYPIKIRYLIAGLMLILSANTSRVTTRAEKCPDVRVVFARGSGGELGKDQNYLAYKKAIELKLATTSLNYEFVDLDYPAIGVGIDNLKVTVGAYFGAGEAYEFGDSVKSGVKKLDSLVNSLGCPGTKYILGGYSQGAMVISKALPNLKAERIIYAATFGDPKIYLPEGKGIIPAACSGRNLSEYRAYVPDCHAYKGLLGAYMPYEPEALTGKVGTWCNKNDLFCSSHFSINNHLTYVPDNLYEDASRIIFDKIAQEFKLTNNLTSPHDTAIVIDSTGSMGNLIEKYKAEAFRLAKETLTSGGRVALYDYRDLNDPYEPIERCNFKTCTIERFAHELDGIVVDGGGDKEESLLSASFHVMKALDWQLGATKSLVVLTDAGFLSPDRDGITYAEAVRLSKTIDPVNFYIITEPENKELYSNLATDTNGKVVTDVEGFSLLTDYIMERYDSLPRVEEDESVPQIPTLKINGFRQITNTKAEIDLTTTSEQVLVILNDKILGITDRQNIVIDDLNLALKNTLKLIPIKSGMRGEAIELELPQDYDATPTMLKAPNTGTL